LTLRGVMITFILIINNYQSKISLVEKERLFKIQMVYGYAICLVAVITFIICITSMAYSLMDLSDPINAYRAYGKDAPSLASFENYKVDIIRSLDTDNSLKLNDETLHSMYDAAKQDAISKVNHNAYRSVIVNGLVIIITIFLFIFI